MNTKLIIGLLGLPILIVIIIYVLIKNGTVDMDAVLNNKIAAFLFKAIVIGGIIFIFQKCISV